MARNQSITDLQGELSRLRDIGITLPRNPMRAVDTARSMQSAVANRGELKRDISRVAAFETLSKFGRIDTETNPEAARIMENNRALQAAMGSARRISKVRSMRKTSENSQDVAIAIPRFYDPLEYWDLSGLPWNMADEGHRHKLHKWLRLYYATHRLIPTCIDVFTRFPLIGLEMYSPDKKVTDFYKDLFLNELEYEEFLVGMGREYWTVGEAFPLGSFNEGLGVWEREELLNPEDIVIENFPLLGTRQMKVVPPEYLKRLATTKSPPDQFEQLEMNFPDLLPYLRRGEPFPVSETLLKQVAFKITDWDDHGTPIMLRGLRTLLHEEKLLASQDAIAERLYSPLILAKLGINNMGDDEGPWIPGPDQLESFRDDMDLALSSDFRLMVYHYGLEIENVFGREQVPDLWNDFDRIERWILSIFGLQNMWGGGAGAQPYATSALNAEFMNQVLKTYQKFLQKHMKERMEVVAEAQGHYAYEKRGQTRVPIMEEVVEWDEEGEPHIVRRNKLLVPDVNFESLDMRDQSTERMFLQSLRATGVPISDERLMVGLEFEWDDSLDEMYQEIIQKTVTQQMAKLQAYKILRAQGLSIPPELQMELEGGPGPAGAPPGGGMPPGGAGMGAPAPMGGMGMGMGGGGMGGLVMPPPPPGMGGKGGLGRGGPGAPPYPAAPIAGGGTVPNISQERRQGMPGIGNPAITGFPGPRGASWAKTAGFSPEEIETYEKMSDVEIDDALESNRILLADLDFQKRMRKSNFERSLEPKYASDDIMSLPEDASQEIIVDLVPPKVRNDLLS